MHYAVCYPMYVMTARAYPASSFSLVYVDNHICVTYVTFWYLKPGWYMPDTCTFCMYQRYVCASFAWLV